MILLSLCDYSGVWSWPFLDAGWEVIQVDVAHRAGWTTIGSKRSTLGADVRNLDRYIGLSALPLRPDAVIAAPPCTCFCRPAARWWKRQDESGQTDGDIATLRACLEWCRRAKLWWALENPPGRHQKLIPELGPPAWQYQPWEHGDPWIKQTYLWGTARWPLPSKVVTPPPTRRTPNGKTQGRIAFMSSSWKRQREQTPSGFAEAFARENA